MEKAKLKRPLIFYVGIFLFVFFMFTMTLTSGLMARYTAKASGGDATRVAKFDIDESLGDIVGYIPITVKPDGKFRPGDVFEYPVTITNKSEVTVRYSVIVTREIGVLPLVAETISEELAPGASTIVSVTVKWPPEENSPELMGLTEILSFLITAEQCD